MCWRLTGSSPQNNPPPHPVVTPEAAMRLMLSSCGEVSSSEKQSRFLTDQRAGHGSGKTRTICAPSEHCTLAQIDDMPIWVARFSWIAMRCRFSSAPKGSQPRIGQTALHSLYNG